MHKNVHKKEQKIETIPVAVVNQLRLEIVPLTEHSLFEHSHFFNVERHIKALASKRKMDENLALCIAYFHDISRIKEGVNGRIHAKRSAEIAKERFKKISKGMLSDSTQDTIYSAILHHNQKSKVHGPFDELIKDADSLAHQDEFGFPSDNDFEQIRLDLMNLEEVRFSVSKTTDVLFIYSRYCEQLLALLRTPPTDINHWVHEVRIMVRKLRALLYFNDNKTLKKDTFSALKPIFKVLSKSRTLYVLYRSLETFEPLNDLKTSLAVILEDENDKLRESIKVHYTDDYVTSIEHLLTMNEGQLSFDDTVLSSLITRYFKYLNGTVLSDIDTLHQLRIEGKQLKYLMGSGLVEMTHPVFAETLLTLHELLGDLNDLSDKAHFFKHYKMSFDERQFLTDQMESQTQLLETEIKKRLFLMKKLISLNKIIL